MSNKPKLPHEELVKIATESFRSISDKFTQMHNVQLDQAKQLFAMCLEGGESLAKVNEPTQFTKTWNDLLQKNGAAYTKMFLDDLNHNIDVVNELCDSSAVSSEKIKDLSIKFIDFYLQLVPSNEVFEMGGHIRNAVNGNISSIDALRTIVKSAVKQCGDQVRSSAERTLDHLNKLATHNNVSK